MTMMNDHNDFSFIRGVNIGGWLVMERYITPYSFAVTDCHQRGDFCWYPGQIDAPPSLTTNSNHNDKNITTDDSIDHDYKLCNITECNAVLSPNVFGAMDYPMDEWHLAAAFAEQPEIGAQWLNSHFEHFLQKDDLIQAKEAGITHLRVPLPHWILGDIRENEPWIAADRWKYFLRLCTWVRQIGGLEIWPNIHTAPGSQNGFDNSGVQNSVKTCGGWNDNPRNVQRSLDVLLEVAVALKDAGVLDVVTGFGLLNEPFGDCNEFQYKKFLRDGITIIRTILGDGISIYMSDLFQAPKFNDGQWGLDETEFHDTFLDSHYYNIFSPALRKLSPQEHVDAVCHPEFGERVADCCYEDGPAENQIPSRHGTQRIVAEWSAAFDAMPGEVLKPIMKGIYEHGVAPIMDRQLSDERKSFLKKFIQAQIVSYEAASVGVSRGWFYWTLKMEGGGYIEWDFLRSVQEGWFPEIAPPNVASETLYGSCMDIRDRTNETMEIVHVYPWGDPAYWRGSLVNETDTIVPETTTTEEHRHKFKRMGHHDWMGYGGQVVMIAIVALLVVGWRRYSFKNSKKWQYTEIQT